MKFIFIILLALKIQFACARANISQLIKQDQRFTTLSELIVKYDLDQTLQNGGPFTLFAPTDQAFAQFVSEQEDNLRELLLFHLVFEDIKPRQLFKKEFLPTLSGKALMVSKRGIQGISVNQEAIKASNGRIYVLDNIFQPRRNQPTNVLKTVSYVDLTRYQGTWYEIARYKNNFQKKCLASQAHYQLNSQGKIEVKNSCQQADHKIDVAKALAAVDDPYTFAKLKVSFVPLLNKLGWFAGDYWILDLDKNYQHVMIGEPSRKFFWILARNKTIAPEIYESLLRKAEFFGYNVNKIFLSEVWKD